MKYSKYVSVPLLGDTYAPTIPQNLSHIDLYVLKLSEACTYLLEGNRPIQQEVVISQKIQCLVSRILKST